MPSPPKHNDNLAFMPSSNDTLYTTISIENYPSKNQNPNALPAPSRQDSSPSYFSPNLRTVAGSTAGSSKAGSPMSRPSSLPRSQLSRERTAQATQATVTQPTTQAGTDEEPDPTDEIFWYNLHMETLQNFERERTMWRRMTERLTKEMEKVRLELQQTRARAVRGELQLPQLRRSAAGGDRMASTGNGLAEQGIQEEDKVFLDRQIMDQAHAKLREISVMSPAKEVGNPFDKPSPTQVDGVTFKRPSALSQQPSQEESGRDRSQSSRKVTISNAAADTISETPTNLPGKYSPFHNPPSQASLKQETKTNNPRQTKSASHKMNPDHHPKQHAPNNHHLRTTSSCTPGTPPSPSAPA